MAQNNIFTFLTFLKEVEKMQTEENSPFLKEYLLPAAGVDTEEHLWIYGLFFFFFFSS